MNITPLLIAALVVVPAAGLVAWEWFAMARVDEQLRPNIGFERMDFEI